MRIVDYMNKHYKEMLNIQSHAWYNINVILKIKPRSDTNVTFCNTTTNVTLIEPRTGR